MAYRMEPGQTYNSWMEFKQALDEHCEEQKVLFNIGHAKTVEQANSFLKKPPYFLKQLKYSSAILRCKHYGSYTSLSVGIRPKQRSYKVDCKAMISVSACRKGGYLIIRDAYHKHSHPCNDEIYKSYPEVRRMSNSEKKMVGSLMDMGVPIAQIKMAIGRNITPKDLHNARSQLKRVEMGLKPEEKSHSSRRTRNKGAMGPSSSSSRQQSDNEDTLKYDSLESSPIGTKRRKVDNDQMLDEMEKDIVSLSSDQRTTHSPASQGAVRTEFTESNINNDGNSNIVAEEDNTDAAQEDSRPSGLAELLAAAGVSSDSVVLTVNQGVKPEDTTEGGQRIEDCAKNSYTVTISLPEGDVTHTGTDLQELLKGLPLNEIGALKAMGVNYSSMDHQTKNKASISKKTFKHCVKCENYMSPLDRHDLCLQCLGPEHLTDEDCVHCKAMKPEQLNIRRKQMVRQRMKMLKSLQEKRMNRVFAQQTDSDEITHSVLNVRKSKRGRKPKTFGPEFTVGSSSVQMAKISQNISKLPLKTEPLDDFNHINFEYGTSDYGFNEVSSQTNNMKNNSPRFDHFLKQSIILGDVFIEEGEDGSVNYAPDETMINEFNKIMKMNPACLPAAPAETLGRYSLHPKFEDQFCSDIPPSLHDPLAKGNANVFGNGLRKLAANAAVQTRLAIYDQLFSRLGLGMADEALSILSKLYGRVSNVTEISQEDLTNNLQTALDTIQALKDLLQELGVMSQDAVHAAAHQRSLSVQSLNLARRQVQQGTPTSILPPPSKGKFKPFSTLNLPFMETKPKTQPSLENIGQESEVVAPQFPNSLVVASSSESEQSCATLGSIAASIASDLTTETTQTLLNVSGKEYTVSPIAVTNFGVGKDNVIELHVMKEDGMELLTTSQAAIEEVIQTQTSEELTSYQLTE